MFEIQLQIESPIYQILTSGLYVCLRNLMKKLFLQKEVKGVQESTLLFHVIYKRTH